MAFPQQKLAKEAVDYLSVDPGVRFPPYQFKEGQFDDLLLLAADQIITKFREVSISPYFALAIRNKRLYENFDGLLTLAIKTGSTDAMYVFGGEAMLHDLCDIWKRPESSRRQKCIDVLLDAMARVLEDKDSKLRRYNAADTLLQFPLLDDTTGAIYAFHPKYGSERAVSTLQKYVSDPDVEVRKRAVKGLCVAVKKVDEEKKSLYCRPCVKP